MKSHEVDYKILGDDLQMVEITLDPGETVIAEAGSMMYMEDGVSYEAKMSDGSEPDQSTWSKLKSAGKRAISQESIFLTHFTNQSEAVKTLSFSGEFPGKIIPFDLKNHNGKLICQKDAFLCAALGTKLDIAFQKKLGAGFFGGEGFIMQTLEGDGMAFTSVGGSIIEKSLDESGKLLVDTGCIVALESSVEYNIETTGSLKSAVFGGEGIFLASLTGTGKVWLQSLPFSRLASRILAAGTYQNKGEGSVLGGVSTIFSRE